MILVSSDLLKSMPKPNDSITSRLRFKQEVSFYFRNFPTPKTYRFQAFLIIVERLV